jgi:hypothetical protein
VIKATGQEDDNFGRSPLYTTRDMKSLFDVHMSLKGSFFFSNCHDKIANEYVSEKVDAKHRRSAISGGMNAKFEEVALAVIGFEEIIAVLLDSSQYSLSQQLESDFFCSAFTEMRHDINEISFISPCICG